MLYRDLHAVCQQYAIGKARERIVVREIHDSLLRGLALGDIARKDNESLFHSRVGMLARYGKLEPQLALGKIEFQLFARRQPLFPSLAQRVKARASWKRLYDIEGLTEWA